MAGSLLLLLEAAAFTGEAAQSATFAEES